MYRHLTHRLFLSAVGAIALGASLATAPALAQAPAKKLLRIHTAGPNDVNVDNTKMAMEFANQVNAAGGTVEVKVFPASQLGQSREVI